MNVPTGYTELDLVGFTDRGDYDSTATYVKNDLVKYGGKKWKCKQDDVTDITPVEGLTWSAFIDAGVNALSDLEDTTITTPTDGQALIYDSTTQKWVNGPGVPTGGTTNQALLKNSNSDGDTKWADVATPDMAIRPNLLKNWNFANPVNTQGQSSYTGTTETIDNWYIVNWSSLVKNTGYISVSPSTLTKQAIFQYQMNDLNLIESLEGKTCTLSWLTYDGTLYDWTFVMPTNGNRVTKAGWITSVNATVINNRTAQNTLVVCLYRNDSGADVTANFVAAKLEIGEGQTLCHKENGVWVLNEVENTESWQNTNQISAMQEAGAYNLFKHTRTISQTVNGVTLTFNDDKTVTLNGTANANAEFTLTSAAAHDYWLDEPAGKYKFSGCPAGGSPTTYYQTIAWRDENDVLTGPFYDFGDGVTVDFPGGGYLGTTIVVLNGVTVNNLSFKTMFYDERFGEPPYQPFTMTNRGLTDELALEDITNQLQVNTSRASYQTFTAFRFGRVVQVSFTGLQKLTTDNAFITIPEKYRPYSQTNLPIYDASCNLIGGVYANTGGAIAFFNAQAINKPIYVNLVWLI